MVFEPDIVLAVKEPVFNFRISLIVIIFIVISDRQMHRESPFARPCKGECINALVFFAIFDVISVSIFDSNGIFIKIPLYPFDLFRLIAVLIVSVPAAVFIVTQLELLIFDALSHIEHRIQVSRIYGVEFAAAGVPSVLSAFLSPRICLIILIHDRHLHPDYTGIEFLFILRFIEYKSCL